MTAAELRAIVAEALRGPKGNAGRVPIPDDTKLSELAAIVTAWQLRFRGHAESGEAAKAAADAEIIRRAEAAAEELRALMPDIERIAAGAGPGDPFGCRNLRRVEKMKHALAFRLPPCRMFRALGRRDALAPGWQWLAGTLRGDCERALGALGTRDDGPLPRLMALLLGTITGDAPTPAAVASHLRRLDRERT